MDTISIPDASGKEYNHMSSAMSSTIEGGRSISSIQQKRRSSTISFQDEVSQTYHIVSSSTTTTNGEDNVEECLIITTIR